MTLARSLGIVLDRQIIGAFPYLRQHVSETSNLD